MDIPEKSADALVSIVIPVYKVREGYLRQCIESCMDQSHQAIEIILVDDGSPDGCGAICDAYAEKDCRVRVIHQENAGVSAARNAGVQRATGEWVIFVDGDDWLEPRAVQVLMEEASLCGHPDVLIFSLYRDYETSRTAYRPLYPPRQVFAREEELLTVRRDILEKPLADNVLVFPYCKLIKRALLCDIQPCFPQDLAMCEDVVFSLKLLLSAMSVAYCAEALYHYRQHGGSAVNRYRPNAETEQETLLRYVRDIIQKTPCPEAFTQGYYLEAFYAMQRVIMQGYYNKDNPMKRVERNRKCAALFAKEPYRSVFLNIDRKRLSRNHRVKAFLIRRKLYGSVSLLRNLFFSLPGHKHAA